MHNHWKVQGRNGARSGRTRKATLRWHRVERRGRLHQQRAIQSAPVAWICQLLPREKGSGAGGTGSPGRSHTPAVWGAGALPEIGAQAMGGRGVHSCAGAPCHHAHCAQQCINLSLQALPTASHVTSRHKCPEMYLVTGYGRVANPVVPFTSTKRCLGPEFAQCEPMRVFRYSSSLPSFSSRSKAMGLGTGETGGPSVRGFRVTAPNIDVKRVRWRVGV